MKHRLAIAAAGVSTAALVAFWLRTPAGLPSTLTSTLLIPVVAGAAGAAVAEGVASFLGSKS